MAKSVSPGFVSLLITFWAVMYAKHPKNNSNRIVPVLIPLALLLLLCFKNFYNTGFLIFVQKAEKTESSSDLYTPIQIKKDIYPGFLHKPARRYGGRVVIIIPHKTRGHRFMGALSAPNKKISSICRYCGQRIKH